MLARRVAARYAATLTKEWLMGIRRGWLKVMDPPIGDWGDVHRAIKNLGLFVKNLTDQVFYARRGPYTGTPTMSEGAKVLKLLGQMAGAVDELKNKAQHWQTVQEGRALPGFRQEDGEQMLNLYRTNFPGATEFALEKSKGQWKNTSLTELMDKVLKILREDAQRIKDHDEAHPSEPYEDRNVYKEFDLHGMKIVIDDSSLLPSEINEYIKYFDAAYQKLKQKGFGKVWYGTLFVKCNDCGGSNQYGPELGVGGNYPIGPDVVNVFSRPSKFIIELVVHELGHRYWFKQMSQGQRGKFEDLIDIRPAPPQEAANLIPDTKAAQAKARVDLAYDTLKRLLKDFGSSRLKWFPDIIKKFEEPMIQASYQATQDLITAMQSSDSWVNTPEIKKLHEEALEAARQVTRMFSDMDTRIRADVHKAPEPKVAPENLNAYWLSIFRPIQKWWIEDATITIEGAITAGYIYIDASIQAYNQNEKDRSERANKQWFEKFKEMEKRVPPVSNYGGKHIDEAFAEAFMHYVTEQEMTRDQIDSFKSVLKTAGDRVSQRYALTKTIDTAWVEKLRKDFLILVKNLPRVKDYETGAELREAFKFFRKNFYLWVFEEFLNPRKYNEDRAFEGIRKPAWDFYAELSMPLGYPDGYNNEAMLFNRYEGEAKTWEQRLRSKAQKFWKDIKDTLSYVKDQKADVEVPDVDRLVLEGFQVEIKGYEAGSDWQQEAFAKVKEALRQYRSKARARLPWLIQKQLPLVLNFQSKLDEGGLYEGSHITIAMSALSGQPPEWGVHMLAHEMGHHLYKSLSGGAKEFWDTAIRQDYGPLDLRKLLKEWPESLRWASDFVESRAKSDPVLALQVDVLSGRSGDRDGWTDREYFQRALDGGQTTVAVPKHPITGYAGKNTEESFCEAIGRLVGYGPATVLKQVRDWLDIVIPGAIKTAASIMPFSESLGMKQNVVARFKEAQDGQKPPPRILSAVKRAVGTVRHEYTVHLGSDAPYHFTFKAATSFHIEGDGMKALLRNGLVWIRVLEANQITLGFTDAKAESEA